MNFITLGTLTDGLPTPEKKSPIFFWLNVALVIDAIGLIIQSSLNESTDSTEQLAWEGMIHLHFFVTAHPLHELGFTPVLLQELWHIHACLCDLCDLVGSGFRLRIETIEWMMRIWFSGIE